MSTRQFGADSLRQRVFVLWTFPVGAERCNIGTWGCFPPVICRRISARQLGILGRAEMQLVHSATFANPPNGTSLATNGRIPGAQSRTSHLS